MYSLGINVCPHVWAHNFCLRCGLNLCAKDKKLSAAQLSVLRALQEGTPVNAKDIKTATLVALARRNLLTVSLNLESD